MSPTPVTFASPTQPASYGWEATNEEIASRYGIPIERIARFDLNTSPVPPELAAHLLRRAAAGGLETPISEYPPGDYGELVAAAAARYGVAGDEILVGAGADEILDLVAKAFLAPGRAAIVPAPTYAMYPVLTEQRGARPIRVPRRGPEHGFSLDLDTMRAAASSNPAVSVAWLCSPNNPTALPEPAGAVATLLDGLLADATHDGRAAPAVVVDEAYAEFGSGSLVELRHAYPRLVLVRTMSKAYGIAGLRVGFALARPEVIAEIAPYRPPGSVSVVSMAVATGLLRSDAVLEDRVPPLIAERERLGAALTDAGWLVHPSATNFLLVEFPSAVDAERVAEAMLGRGLVPRTYPADHPLAAHIRLTVRNAEQDDRLVALAREMSRG